MRIELAYGRDGLFVDLPNNVEILKPKFNPGLLDEGATKNVRATAAGYLVELNDLSCIDPLRNHTFRDTALEQQVNMAITELLRKNYKKECPHCLEIIKAQAKKCLHCKEDL